MTKLLLHNVPQRKPRLIMIIILNSKYVALKHKIKRCKSFVIIRAKMFTSTEKKIHALFEKE